MQEAITVGIGLFITYIGIKSAGLIEFSVNAVNNGIASASDVVPQLANFSTKEVILSVIGLLITGILVSKKTKNSYLISILLTTIIGLFIGVTKLPDFTNYTFLPSMSSTFLKLDIAGLFTAKASLIVVFMTIFTLVISDLFDTIGTFIGTGKKAKIFKLDKLLNIVYDGNFSSLTEKLEKWET